MMADERSVLAARSDTSAMRSTVAAPASGGAFAEELRGFGVLGILAVLAIYFANGIVVPLGALLVLLWARWSRTPWRELGFVRPRSWLATIAIGIAFGVALKLVMKAIVMPMLGADPINQTFQYLAANRAAIPAALYAMIIGAGFGEETLFRGFMFERLRRLFGSSAGAQAFIVLVTSLWFGLEHYALQGVTGVQHATIVGLAFGTVFAITGRIWTVMIAHAAFDLTAYAMIYWNLETAVAHWIFE